MAVEILPTLTSTALLKATSALITFPTATLTPCLARADFGDPADSPYILPYPVGKAYRITQSYCNVEGSHSDQFAYDFNLSIGDDVTAARAGRVISVQDDTPDSGTLKYICQPNHIFIKHEDGTAAFYAHLKQNSITVQMGQFVEAGQRIAASGNSGFTGPIPHLHFGVYQYYPPEEGYDVPVNFRNAQDPLDDRGGLIAWRIYEALSY
jgi:murein DD-endopeptidase MepM/ murein hydrolase activator NlpD